MTEFRIKAAGRTAAVRAMFESTRGFCRGYLTGDAPDFLVETDREDIRFEREKSAREDAIEGIPVRQFSDAYLETLAVQRKVTEALFDYDTLLLHGSVIAVDGVGYLFTAKSGTGKSTHTRLWREAFGGRAVMVNDDKPFLEIRQRDVLAHGTPWSGKHGLDTNISVPLRAICVLERGAENRIREISAGEAVFMLLQQSNRPMNKGKMGNYLELIDRLAENVRFFRLECNMDPEAALVAYEAMAREGKDA